ncbi:hypothetical protein HFN80_17515 [Rhizobium laguerreae]|nr:hypothetical protein [Rhizobium laguerreae]
MLQEIVAADILVIGAPTHEGSYPGLFKHLIIIDLHELTGAALYLELLEERADALEAGGP